MGLGSRPEWLRFEGENEGLFYVLVQIPSSVLLFFGLKVLAGRDEEELSCWGWFVMEGEV
jgi:hypothetical protein